MPDNGECEWGFDGCGGDGSLAGIKDDEVQDMSEAKPIINHLIELRKRLIWVIIAMVIGTAACFGFVEQIYDFLSSHWLMRWMARGVSGSFIPG